MRTTMQQTAIEHPCYLAEETGHPRYATLTRKGSVIVTVNGG